MKIAFIGQKGIPATWGGVEEHAEQLSTRLADRGHDVSVYARSWYISSSGSTDNSNNKNYKKVNLISTPSINTKHLDAATHSFFSSLDCLFKDFDIVHYHSIGPSVFSWMPKFRNKKVVATIHRFDYESDKWGTLASRFLKFSEKTALSIPHKTIVVAKYQKDFYEKNGKSVTYIPNGVLIPELVEPQIIAEKHSLAKDSYLLSMGRLTPEKRISLLLKSYIDSGTNLKLVVAGGSSATDQYVNELHQVAGGNKNIIFTGYVKGKEKEELLSNAKAFIIPSALEGLPIALLEAMSYELPCIASDILPHKEVITDGVNGFLFKTDQPEDLAQKINAVTSLKERDIQEIGSRAKELVGKEYDWDKITDEVEKLYESLLK